MLYRILPRGRWAAAIAFFAIAASVPRILLVLLSPDRHVDDPLARLVIVLVQCGLAAGGVAVLVIRRPLPLRPILKRLVTAGAALLFAGLLLEILLRIHPVGVLRTPERYRLPLLQRSAWGGFSLRPGLDLRVRVEGGEAHIVTDASGRRVSASAVRPGPARGRIALVGDSFTFGEWARDYERTFAGVLGALLREWEIRNYGVPSYGLLEALDSIANEIAPTVPDWIVLVVYTGNDFSDTYIGRERYRLEAGTAVWDSAVVESAVGPRPQAAVAAPARRLLETSRAFVFFERTAYAIRKRHLAPRLREFGVPGDPMEPNYWSRTDAPPHMQAAVESVRTAIESIRVACGDANLAIVALPHAAQVYARLPRGARFDTRWPQLHLEAFARRENLPYLDLLPVLRRYALESESPLFCRGDPHLNDTGHHVVGVALARFLRSHVAPPPGTGSSSQR